MMKFCDKPQSVFRYLLGKCYQSFDGVVVPFSCINAIPSRHLLVQIQQWKYQGNVKNLFTVNNKDTRVTSKGPV